MLLQLALSHIGGLGVVAGKKPLVEALVRFQRGLVSQQDFNKLKGFDVPAEDYETYGQGRRQQQSDRSPQQRPEQRRDDNGNRRQAGVLSVEKRFDHMTGNRQPAGVCDDQPVQAE